MKAFISNILPARVTRLALVGTLLSMVVSGCINDDISCPTETDDESMTIQFTIHSRPSDSSRDLSRSVSRAEVVGSVAENYIDITDLQFLLFDADGVLLRPFFPRIVEHAGDYTWYELQASFAEPYFTTAIDNGTDATFSIMAIANARSHNAQNIGLAVWQTTIDNIAGQLRTYESPEGYVDIIYDSEGKPIDNKYRGWSPSVEGKRFIPMSGLQKFTVTNADLKNSSPENPIQLSQKYKKDIAMVRTLAKIEVIDHIDIPEGEAYDPDNREGFKIQKVELCGRTDKATLLPWMGVANPALGYYPQWGESSRQVTAPTVPADSYIAPEPFSTSGYNKSKGILSVTVPTVEKGYNDGFPVYSFYVSEYAHNLIGQLEDPYIVITLDGAAGSPIRKMPLTTYVDGKPDAPLSTLLRNHIYRYVVTSVESIGVDFTLNVVDWESHVTEWDYSENIGIQREGSIKWDPATCSVNTETARVVVRDDWTPAQCSFTINTPVGAEWRAIFVPEGSTPNTAFQFVDENGQPVGGTGESATGLIDGSKSVLRIRPANVTTQTANVVRLYVVVTLPDGRTMTADVCNGTYGNNKYCTIIQNPQL